MGGIGDTFSGMSWLYLLGAAYTVYLVYTNRAELLSSERTARTWQVASLVAFFLLVPVGVLLHEFGHMVAAWTTGSQVLGLHYFLFWGYVSFIPASNSPLLLWYVALAGNFISYALGLTCVALALSPLKMRPFMRVTLMQLGILELVQTLIFYPLISLDPNFQGDWDTIYSFQAPLASGLTLAVHLLSLGAFLYLLRANRQVRYLTSGA